MLLATLLVAAMVATPARAPERGLPVVTQFSAEDFHSGAQTFAATQDASGRMYFGNLGGLLSFDGATWSQIGLPNDSAVFAVAAAPDGRIAAGASREFGIVTRGVYRSIVPLLPEPLRHAPGDVRSICADGDGFLFATERYVVASDGKTARIVFDAGSSDAALRLTRAADAVYVAGRDFVQRIGGNARLFAGRPIEAMLPNGVVAIAGEGLFTLDGARFAPGMTLRNVVGGALLPRGRIAVATREDGIVVLAADGTPEQRIDAASGLGDTVVTSVFCDAEGALWVTTFTGMVRVEMRLPVSTLDARIGLRGNPLAIGRANGRLYVATSKGLFAVDARGGQTTVVQIAGVPAPVWTIAASGETLLAGTSAGVFEYSGGAPRLVAGTGQMTIYGIAQLPGDPRVWIGGRDGMAVLRQAKDGLVLDHVVAGAPRYTHELLAYDGAMWAGTIFDGGWRIDRDERPTRLGGGEVSPAVIDGKIVFVATTGIYAVSGDRLVPHPRHPGAHAGRFFRVVQDASGDLWLNTIPPSRLRRRADGSFSDVAEPLSAVHAGDVQFVRGDDDAIWFGTDRGLVRYEPVPPPPQRRPEIARGVTAEGQTIVDGARLPHGVRRMRIDFAPVSYQPGIAYQYRLDPLDAGWSGWMAEPFIEYTNLAAGHYTLLLRTRGAAGAISPEARWTFEVLPPWYRTWWALVLWALLAVAIVAAIIRTRTAALHRQAATLRARVDEQTLELSRTVLMLEQANVRLADLATHDELTGLPNRRAFDAALTNECERAARRRDPVSLIMIDLDHFKDLNDTEGHAAGDKCLRAVGEFLASAIRGAGDMAARYGGEEFMVLLPGTAREAALVAAERLREGIAHACRITASLGVACATAPSAEEAQQLVADADAAMYRAKNDGRNRVAT